jgi:hypothetical protein
MPTRYLNISPTKPVIRWMWVSQLDERLGNFTLGAVTVHEI